MPHGVESDVTVQRFGYVGDDKGRRLVFPRAETHGIAGRSGATTYGATDALFDGLEGRLDTLRWTADAASLGKAWLRDDGGRFDIAVDRVEMPHGILLTRADRGIELISPHVSLSEMKITIKGPFERRAKPAANASPGDAPHELRQTKLRFLDSLAGRIDVTVKVVLDLPVLGVRTLDQRLKVPIQDGVLNFRALEDNLDWLEGAFLDIKHDEDRLALAWKVPIVGSSREIVAWKLDGEAIAHATFGRVPVRSLVDVARRAPGAPVSERSSRSGILKALAVDAIDVALNLTAPRSFMVAGGVVMFGGDDQPGMVDLAVRGDVHDKGPGKLAGAIGSIDTTIKDVRVGPATFAVDRLYFDGLDELVVEFDGFRPTSATVVIHRVTATNLKLQLGR